MTVRGYSRPQLIVVAVISLVALGVVFSRQLQNVYEDTVFAFVPSAAQAAAYGERHFNAQRPAEYDIDRAEYFYTKAVQLDPTYPYVNHQLARIEFLRGNFNTALFYINKEIELHGKDEPNTYYVRGLIEGYMGRYDDAANDYAQFLKSNPHNWAALNDDAWVLLKAERFAEARKVTEDGLQYFPENPWLLNSNATALYELGDVTAALEVAKRADTAAQKITETQWLTAYPGNDPKVAVQGIATFRKATSDNMHTIEAALASSTVQSR